MPCCRMNACARRRSARSGAPCGIFLPPSFTHAPALGLEHVRLLPDVLAAAAELRRATDDETQAQLAAARDEPIIFPIAENAPR